jgi:hypothetical protein
MVMNVSLAACWHEDTHGSSEPIPAPVTCAGEAGRGGGSGIFDGTSAIGTTVAGGKVMIEDAKRLSAESIATTSEP